MFREPPRVRQICPEQIRTAAGWPRKRAALGGVRPKDGPNNPPLCATCGCRSDRNRPDPIVPASQPLPTASGPGTRSHRCRPRSIGHVLDLDQGRVRPCIHHGPSPIRSAGLVPTDRAVIRIRSVNSAQSPGLVATQSAAVGSGDALNTSDAHRASRTWRSGCVPPSHPHWPRWSSTPAPRSSPS